MDIDYTWNNPSPEQLSALKYVERQIYGKELSDTIPLTHHQVVVLESSYRASAAETGIYPALSEHELAEFVLMAPKSLWYHMAKGWSEGEINEISGDGAKHAMRVGSEAIVKIVDRGYQDGQWWDTAALWPDTTQRAIVLARILEVARIRKLIADRTMYITSAGLNEFVKLIVPGINLNAAFRLLETESGSIRLLSLIKKSIDKDFARMIERAKRDKRNGAHATYEPTKCTKPDCQNQVAPAGVKPREGHFKNYMGKGACCKSHSTYHCSKCNLLHSWTTKTGQSHTAYYAGDNDDSTH